MIRTFETSGTRRQRTLDGPWEFVTDPSDEGADAGYPNGAFPDDADRLVVPSPWQTRPRYYDYHGVAWYGRSFEVPETTAAEVTLHGVGHEATVYVDGKRVAHHIGGYTPVSAVFSDLNAGKHEIVVRADGRIDETTTPHADADWFPYGGIYRDVVLEELPDVSVADHTVSYELNGNDACVDVVVTARNLKDADAERSLVATVGDAHAETTLRIPADGTTSATLSLNLASVELWDIDDPALYDVVVSLGDDEVRDRVGFREIATEGRDVLLNGEAVTLVGVNRHEDHPDWGHAQPARIQEADVDVLEHAGFNTVRCSHYPNHPGFLDRCDEAGILVIEEVPHWQFDAADFADDATLERGKRMLREMVERDRHHPSVVAWSLHNECFNHEDGMYEATAELKSAVTDLDETRLITLASNTDFRGHEDPCFDLCDVLCVNGYWGWYSDDETWDDFLDGVADRYAERPIVVSEFGAGAVPDERTFEGAKWSETYQRETVVNAVETFLNHDAVAGFTVWQFCDTRTTPEREMGRPRTKNNKGLLTEYRRPKEAYWALERLLDERS